MTEFQTVFALSTAITMTLFFGAQILAWHSDRKNLARQFVPVSRFQSWYEKDDR